jgi:hypothetical protein
MIGAYYRFSWDRQRAYRRLVKCENGAFTLLAEDAVRYVSRRTYQLQIVAQSPHLEVWIDNQQIFAVTDTSFAQGDLVLYSWGNAGSQFEAVRVETFPMEVVLLAIETHDGPSANWTVINEGTVAGPSAWAVEQSALVQTACPMTSSAMCTAPIPSSLTRMPTVLRMARNLSTMTPIRSSPIPSDLLLAPGDRHPRSGSGPVAPPHGLVSRMPIGQHGDFH